MSASVTVFPRPVATRPGNPSLKPERVANLIRDMIIQDELTPGMPIRERALSEKLNVSRTPLREALKILSAEGIVELQPRRGAIVAAPSDTEVQELLQLLGALEGFAGATACHMATRADLAELRALHYEMLAAHLRGDRLGYFRRNQEIHSSIVRLTGNSALIKHHTLVNARVYRIRYISNLKLERWEQAIAEHEEILSEMEKGNADTVRVILERHVLKAWEELQRQRATVVTAAASGDETHKD